MEVLTSISHHYFTAHSDIPQVFRSSSREQDSNILQELISYEVNRARERGENLAMLNSA